MTVISGGINQVSRDRYSVSLFKRTLTISAHRVLLAIMALSILLRLASAIYQGNAVTDLPGIYDQISYDGLARRVMDGHGFSFAEGHWPATRAGEPTAHWSYIYTVYLAAIYKVFGTYPLVARIIQACIAGVFQTLLTWRIGRRLFGRTAGLIAAALNAVYTYFFYYAGALITETFYITGILWTFDAAFRLATPATPTEHPEGQRATAWRWTEIGFAIGLTVLLRQVFLLFVPILYLWLWWNSHEKEAAGWKQRLHWSAVKGVSLATLVLVLLILPWTIRNYRAFGTFVLLNTNAGFAFFWGNHPIYGTHFVALLPGGAKEYYELIPKALLPLNEAKLDQALMTQGLRFVLDDPVRFLLLSISRAREFFKFWPSADSGLISNISRTFAFGISLPFMLYGLWLERVRIWRSQESEEKSAVVLLILFVLCYTAIHLFSWALIRYRLPIDAILLMFAAVGLERLWRGRAGREAGNV